MMIHDAEDRANILLVDDQPANLSALDAILGGAGYNLIYVNSGEAALRLLLEHDFAAILLDVRMPGMDGFETARLIRGRKLSRHIPIIFLTAHDDGQLSVEQAYALGAVDYLVKPLVPEILRAKVAGFVELYLAKARAKRQADQLRLLIQGSVDYAIFMLDPAGVVVSWNTGAERINGYRAEEIIGRHFSCFYPEEAILRDWPGEELKRAIAEGSFKEEGWRLRKDGSRFWASVVITALRDESGRLQGFSKVTRDLTERKRTEEELLQLHRDLEKRVQERTQELEASNAALRDSEERLRQINEQLAAASRYKDEFLATLSHELRNPLAPVRNALQIMKLVRNNAEAVDQARLVIERQVSHLVRLVDDLMDVSRISRNKLDLRRETVELASVVQAALETSRPWIDAAGHQLTTDLPAEPVYLEGDHVRLAQVFSNLINNAAKYTQRGGHIWVTAEVRGSEAVVTVRDNGMGIPREKLPHVFEMFTQIDRSLERSHGGLGIGLSLVQRLTFMHGGSVEAHSKGQGQGSEFVVRLPVKPSTLAPLAAAGHLEAPASTTAQCRVLVVDDNRDSAASLSLLLGLMGHEVRTAHDGLEAIEVAEAFQPDVILLDIGLPKLNGFDACRRIRATPAGKDMMLIAMTGWGQEEDRQRSRASGFDLHLVKPLDPQALGKLLAELHNKCSK